MLIPLADQLGLSRLRHFALAIAVAVLCALPVVYAVFGLTGIGGVDAPHWLETWVTFIGFAAGAALCLARSRAVDVDRGA